MGYPMAERLLKAGHSVAIWNRTRAKAEPLAKKGGRIVDQPSELAGQDIVFTMVSTGSDLEQVYFGANGLVAGTAGTRPKILVDCSSIGIEQSEAIRARLKQLGCEFIVRRSAAMENASKRASSPRWHQDQKQHSTRSSRILRLSQLPELLTWARANWRACAKSRTTSFSAW